MSNKSNIINNNYFSPLKIIQNKNSNRSQPNIFSSSERKKKSLEKSNDFLSNTIKKTNEEEYQEIINKRKITNKKIDELILLLSQNQVNKDSPQHFKNKSNNNFQKYLHENGKKNKNLEKMKKNEELKKRNDYLKNVLKEMRKKNILNNSKNIENKNNNNLTYDFLLKQNKELNDENKNLKDEYNLLLLEQKSNQTLEKVFENKNEVISKMKALKFSMNNLLNLISNSTISKEEDKFSQNNNLLKTHTINKYDLPLKIDYPEHRTIATGSGQNNNIIFTEGGNLNTNNNNSYYNDDYENENYNYNFNEESSDNEQFEISLKQFEKTQNKNFNNLIINSGELNSNHINNNININKIHTENATTRQNINKKVGIYTEKRKNTMTTNSYSKDIINNKKKKDFKKYFNEGKTNGENNTNYNYNFFNFRNIYLDKKILFDNNKKEKNNTLKNNRTSSNFKNNKINKKISKGISDNFRSKNINVKKYKNNNIYPNDFRRMIIPSKKIFK